MKKFAQWPLGAVNEQNEFPLRHSAGQPVVANAEELR
jgi:hypothetical protein